MARVLFFQDTLYEAFGPEILSAVLKEKGHECQLVVAAEIGPGNLIAEARRHQAQIAAFSVPSYGFQWALELAADLKQEVSVTTVFGGPHPSCFSGFAAHPAVDLACNGEGEGAIVELAQAIDEGTDPREIANLSWANKGAVHANPVRPLIEDLDSLPFQDREIYYGHPILRDFSYKLFLAGRGCPYDCSYCFNSTLRATYKGRGRWVRRRSVEHVIEEICTVRDRFGLRTVGFVDDDFAARKDWLLRFCSLYATEVGLPFNCIVRINEIDEEVAEALGRAGCHYVSFAIETGNEELRQRVLNRRISDEQIRRGAALLRGQGIRLLTCNMFGLPGETLEDGLQTVRLNAEIGTSVIGSSVLQPMPGTAIHDYCREHDYLDEVYDPEGLDGFAASSALNNMPDYRHLTNVQKLALIGVRWPRTIPWLGRLATLPPNPLFRLVYLASMFIRFTLRCRLSLLEAVRLGLRSWGRFS
jgi:anaerobic magnesium-protoporphyrin IX monomethyl ester cyclase